MKLLLLNIFFLGITMFSVVSCVKKDNYEGPNASLAGKVMQDGADSTVQTCSANFSIRLEQLSWDSTPVPQDIPVKNDGTYQNTKLFSGHYRISIHGGAFWPVAPDEINISQGSTYDFSLIPYLLLKNFTATLTDSTTLKLHFNLDAPAPGIPKILEIQPYVNSTQIVGPGASIYDFSDLNKVTVNKEWADFTDADKSRDMVITKLIPGRMFYVRVGVKFDNNDKSSNLSSVIPINVPGK